jgi:hypothetical protein
VTPEQEQRLGPFDLTDAIGTSIGAKGNAVDRTLPRYLGGRATRARGVHAPPRVDFVDGDLGFAAGGNLLVGGTPGASG